MFKMEVNGKKSENQTTKALEEMVLKWLMYARSQNVPILGPFLKEKAIEI